MANNLIEKLKGSVLVSSFYKNVRYNDEPLLHQYTAIVKDKKKNANFIGSGMSFDKEKAQNKALGEAVERFCLSKYYRKNFVYSKYKNRDYINPKNVVSLSEKQLREKKYQDFVFDKDSKFWWTKGFDLFLQKPVLIPAQLIYLPYKYINEQVIRFPISTGAALGKTLSSAILKGLCEVVERDSFMIFYLNRISPPMIDLNKSGEKLNNIKCLFDRYKLNLYVFDITTNLDIPVCMAVIVDITGIGPYISIGMKCSVDIHESILGAIEEAEHTRPWMRSEINKIKNIELNSIINNPERIINPRERGIYWYGGIHKDDLNFLWNNKSFKIIKDYKKSSIKKDCDRKNLNIIKTKLRENGNEVYYVDLTPPCVSKINLSAAKVIIPQLQPLYLDENYPYLGGERLYKVPNILGCDNKLSKNVKFSKIPHPFL